MKNQKIMRQFGLWESPISPRSLGVGLRFSDVGWDDSGALVWLENRSDRGVLVVLPFEQTATRDLNSDFSARAKVGYGGGDFVVGKDHVYFVEAESGRIFKQPVEEGTALPITPEFGSSSSPRLSPDGRWLLFVRSYEGRDTIEIVDVEGEHWPQKLVGGEDFYMQPVWAPDGRKVAWICWDHPNMPWDTTTLQIGNLRHSETALPVIEEVSTINGGENISVFQPEFSPDSRYLAYVSDASGWWQIYLYDFRRNEHTQVTHALAEHGAPAWEQGIRMYGFSPDGAYIYFTRNERGKISLWQYDIASARERHIFNETGYTWLSQISISPSGVAMIASGPGIPHRVLVFDPQNSHVRVIRRSSTEELLRMAYSMPEPLEWVGMDESTVHGVYYPPCSQKFEGLGLPPLIVYIHGGPTSQSVMEFNPRAQFFTSRGYSVLEVNYRGSTGYGREYRDKLRGDWGIYDVQDAVSGAQHLVDSALADKERLIILGGSAGGFTVLKALEDYPGFFKAGVCLYGVSNQFTLAAEIHKFEQFYSVSLLGALPEAAPVYYERSPIFFVDRIRDPVAVFQGENDRVVPRRQSDEIVESLERRGISHIYHVYPGEGHGFRKSETIEHFYTEVEKFLRQYVIFT